jgi:hypothetical protein
MNFFSVNGFFVFNRSFLHLFARSMSNITGLNRMSIMRELLLQHGCKFMYNYSFVNTNNNNNNNTLLYLRDMTLQIY